MTNPRQPDWQSEDGAIRLYCGDCLEILPTLEAGSVDAVVTDPPYGINYIGSPGLFNGSSIHTKKAGLRTKEKVVGDDSPFDPAPFIAWPCVFTGAQHFYDRLPRGGSLHSWDKRGDYKRLSFADADIVWCSHKINSQTFRLVWRGLCRHDEYRQKIQHPTQKPVALMKWCMSFVNGEVILDPFMGSGTTGVACIQTGRKFVGIEKEPKYFEIAVARIKKALREEKEKLQFA